MTIESLTRHSIKLFESYLPLYNRIYLNFSGGKESSVIAHLLLPYQTKVSLVVVDTGIVAPHVMEYIDTYRAHFDVIVLESSAPAVWDSFGPPTRLVPIRNTLRRKMLSVRQCCDAVVSEPLRRFAAAHADSLHIQGLRMDDGTRDPREMTEACRIDTTENGDAVQYIRPLWRWTEADVFRYVDEYNIQLPVHYSQGVVSSLDCLLCPAFVTKARMEFLQRYYPRYAPIMETMIDANIDDAEEVLAIYKEAAAMLDNNEVLIVPR